MGAPEDEALARRQRVRPATGRQDRHPTQAPAPEDPPWPAPPLRGEIYDPARRRTTAAPLGCLAAVLGGCAAVVLVLLILAFGSFDRYDAAPLDAPAAPEPDTAPPPEG